MFTLLVLLLALLALAWIFACVYVWAHDGPTFTVRGIEIDTHVDFQKWLAGFDFIKPPNSPMSHFIVHLGPLTITAFLIPAP